MCAVAILGIAIVGLVSLGVQSSQAVQRAASAEADILRANAFLEAVALWEPEDLDRRLGNRSQGSWRLEIQRPEQGLYEVLLTDSSGSRELLRTVLFRPSENGP